MWLEAGDNTKKRFRFIDTEIFLEVSTWKWKRAERSRETRDEIENL